jgi:hypothetical protein
MSIPILKQSKNGSEMKNIESETKRKNALLEAKNLT